jgi:hypothetical protein
LIRKTRIDAAIIRAPMVEIAFQNHQPLSKPYVE